MFLKLCPQLFVINSSWLQFWLFLKLLVFIHYMTLLPTYCKFKIWSQNKSESMDLDCKQWRAKFQNKNLCHFEPIEYLRQTVSNLSKTKIAFVLIKYRVFLKILTHLFSVFEGLNVCQGTCAVHETKEGFMEICLTACMLSSIRWCDRTKEKAKTLQFHF